MRAFNIANNQIVTKTEEGQYFFSYGSLIAFKPANGDTPIVTNLWDYSATTLKYLKQFLGTTLSKKQLADRINSGSIILDNELQGDL